MIIELLKGVALILSLSLLQSFIRQKWREDEIIGRVISGILFGGICIVGMKTPLVISPGVIFDPRSVILSTSGLFGGPIVGVIAAAIAASYRFSISGEGTGVGITVIISSVSFGLIYRYFYLKNWIKIGPFQLLAFGFLLHAFVILLFTQLPDAVVQDVMNNVALPLLLTFTPAVAFLGYLLQDIENRLFLDAALQESEQQKRLILNAVPDLIWLKDNKGTYLACNQLFERFFGAKEIDIIGRTDYDFVDKNQADSFRQHDQMALEAKTPLVNEEWITFSDNGQKALLETTKTLMRNTDGEVIGILGVGHNITARNKSEQALIENEHWLSESQRVAKVGHYSMDFRTGFWESSKALDDIFGIDESYTRDVKGWLSLVHPAFREEMSFYLQTTIITHHKSFDKKYKIVDHSTQEEKWVNGLGELKFDENDSLIGLFGTIQDVSASKQNELQLERTKDLAEKSSKAKSEFLASMSHELRTPLNAVLGFAQMLQFDPKNPLSPTQNENVEFILAGGAHLLELVNQILDLAQIEANQVHISVHKVNVLEVLEDCIQLISPLARSRDIKIVNNITKNEPPTLRTDQTRFKQVLINILSNAVKYNKDGGMITLTSEELGDGFLRIMITDTGSGIPKNKNSGVFEIFNRLGGDAMIAKEGTGIGLPVSKMLIDRLSGRIGFESEVDVGSTFWIELPLASNKDVVIWAENLRVGVDPIDKDHQALISLTNRISYDDIKVDELNDIVMELIEYTRFHFRREEAIMEICEYPDLENHKKLHSGIAKNIDKLADNWREDHSPETLLKLRKFMRDWLIDHVLTEDMEIAKFTKGKREKITVAMKITV